jgi:DNA-binding PadR family transcriptional regulator
LISPSTGDCRDWSDGDLVAACAWSKSTAKRDRKYSRINPSGKRERREIFDYREEREDF